MQEDNGLNDILLDKSASNNNTKKMVLAVAVLLIVAIVVIVITRQLSDDTQDQKATLPPQPKETVLDDDPLFEPVDVIDEDDNNLAIIAQKLKRESLEKKTAPVIVVEEDVVIVEPAIVKPIERAKEKGFAPKSSSITVNYYVQVGSFTKYEPDARFLGKITTAGYKFMYHKATVNGKIVNKVLIGPYSSEKEARKALLGVKKKIIPGAFLTKV
ncbi:MAG: SPOR domain-containing protein [Helicobacteraceae bacterium]|nr:SPOR domain-containing protein [Helicobacteraceae bacterium]